MLRFTAMLIPLCPWEFDPAESDPHIFQTIVDDFGIFLDILEAEVSSEASELSARPGQIKFNTSNIMVSNAVHSHDCRKIGPQTFPNAREQCHINDLVFALLLYESPY